MDIKYYADAENGRVYAIGTGKKGFAEGIDPAVAEFMIAHGYVLRKDLVVPQITRGLAQVQEPDEYDYEIGRAIARDKVLTKHYKRVGRALAAYQAGIKEMSKANSARRDYCDDKVENAKKRLDAID